MRQSSSLRVSVYKMCYKELILKLTNKGITMAEYELEL